MHKERHRRDRVGWLRAAVLGANDGIVSTASLMLGVAAAETGRSSIILAGIAGMIAGAMSMAAGEYVSVSSQSDAEAADLARERAELEADPKSELAELAGIYQKRGLEPALAQQVAQQLMAEDALGAHARDELGIEPKYAARPLQAAGASALAFAVGAALPLALSAMVPSRLFSWIVPSASLFALALLGAVAARVGGAPMGRAALRVAVWGGVAMAITAGGGAIVGAFGL